MIAYGTPEELKATPEVSPTGTRRIEVNTSKPTAALTVLKRQPYIRDATMFGESIHLLMDEQTSLKQIEQDIVAAGFAPPELRLIQPSLEDVFVTLTNTLKEQD